MNKITFLFGIALLSVVLLASAATATTLAVQGGSIPVVGNNLQVGVTADAFPDGLSGYEFNVTLTNPGTAEIVGVTFPGWALITENSSVNSDSVRVKAFAGLSVPPGSTNVQLVSVTVRGDAVGTTNVTVSDIKRFDSYSGNLTIPTIIPGTIVVGNPPTTTIPTTTVTTTATTIPTTTVTTTATTTVTTTATTTIPTTTVTTTATTIPTTTVTTTATTIPTTTVTTPVPPGTITIVTFPGGATAALDGNVIGVTPIVGKAVPAGTYTLSLSRTGYKTYIETITVIPGEETAVDNYIILQPGSGTVTPVVTSTITPTTVITTPTTTITTTSTTAVTTAPTPSPSVSPSPSPTDGNSSLQSALLEYWKNVTQNTSNTFSQLIQKFL